MVFAVAVGHGDRHARGGPLDDAHGHLEVRGNLVEGLVGLAGPNGIRRAAVDAVEGGEKAEAAPPRISETMAVLTTTSRRVCPAPAAAPPRRWLVRGRKAHPALNGRPARDLAKVHGLRESA